MVGGELLKDRSEVLQPKLPIFGLCNSPHWSQSILGSFRSTQGPQAYAVTLDRAKAIATNTDISKCYSTIKSIWRLIQGVFWMRALKQRSQATRQACSCALIKHPNPSGSRLSNRAVKKAEAKAHKYAIPFSLSSSFCSSTMVWSSWRWGTKPGTTFNVCRCQIYRIKSSYRYWHQPQVAVRGSSWWKPWSLSLGSHPLPNVG